LVQKEVEHEVSVSDEFVYNYKHLFRLSRGQFWFGFAFSNPREHEVQTLFQIVVGSISVRVRVLQSDEFVYHNKHQFRLLRGQFRFGFAFFPIQGNMR